MKKPICLLIAFSLLGMGLASSIKLPKKLVYNASESAPIGLYWIDRKRAKRGDFVYAHAPGSMQEMMLSRRYLPPNVALIKKVVGISGDQVCRFGAAVFVNRVKVAEALSSDASGSPMPRWKGCRVLSENEIFLLQDHPKSFDGRYFGPIDRGLIIGRATLLASPFRDLYQAGSNDNQGNIVSHENRVGGQDKRGWCKAPPIPVCTSVSPAPWPSGPVQVFQLSELI